MGSRTSGQQSVARTFEFGVLAGGVGGVFGGGGGGTAEKKIKAGRRKGKG